MKILWLGRNDNYSMSSRLYYLRKALSKIATVIPHGQGFQKPFEWDVLKLEKQHEPDIIFLRGGRGYSYNFNRPTWKNLEKVKTPKVLNYSDPQTERYRIDWVNQVHVDMTFHIVKQCYSTVEKQVVNLIDKFNQYAFKGHKSVWMPFAVDVEVFKDYKFYRIFDVGLFGRVYWLYPLRKVMWKTLLCRPEITKEGFPDVNICTYKDRKIRVFHRRRPTRTWDWTPELRKRFPKVLIQDDYAKAVSRCKMVCFDGSRYRFASMKYYESMATKTLVVANEPEDGADLGFIPDVNYVEVNKNNFMDKIIYYLENEKERKRIIENGYTTINKYHTTDIRAKQILEHLKELI